MARIAATCTAAVALAAAGCGGADPLLPRRTAEPLAVQARAVAARLAAGDACGARDHARTLRQRAVGAVDAGRIPASVGARLLRRANALVAELEPACLPSVAPRSPAASPLPVDGGSSGSEKGGADRHEPRGKGERKGHGDHGHGHRHGKGGKD